MYHGHLLWINISIIDSTFITDSLIIKGVNIDGLLGIIVLPFCGLILVSSTQLSLLIQNGTNLWIGTVSRRAPEGR